MSMMLRAMAVAVLALGMVGKTLPARAQQTAPIQIASGVQYEFIGRWDTDKLNEVLTRDTPKLFDVSVNYTAAKNAVKLYRVTYSSVVPERGNMPIVATGLIAVPDIVGTSFPMVSYQHGTVYEKTQVPSFPNQSPETQLMLAQFAGQGYIVIGADYFGMGSSKEPEGYMVKASHQQASFDMLLASRAVLADLKLSSSKLFVSGWSQGGFVAMAFLEKLESVGEKVDAAATASAPVDVSVALNGFLSFPRKIDADWVNSLFILSSFSFENYFGVPGLARSLIADAYYDVARKAYLREPFNVGDVPTDLHKLIKPEYFNAQFFAASAYGKLVAQATAYRWIVKSPVRNYYGEADEAITVGLGRLAMTYQRAIGNGNPQVEAISTGQTSHRGTYATAVPQWKAWFDGL